MKDVIVLILGIGAMFFVAFLISIYDHISRLKYIKKKIIENYGKEINLEEVDLNMKSISSYFRNKKEKSSIDDITWNDLSMDDVFKIINNTQSTAGAELLYDILRNPLYEKEKLNKRDNLIEYFRKNEKERKEVQYILGKLEKSNDLYTSNCLFNKLDTSKNKLLQYRILSYIPAVSLILIFFNGYFFILLVASIIVNIYISQNNKKYNYNTDGFTYMISIVNTANKIKALSIDEINNNLDNIDKYLEAVKGIRKKYIGFSTTNLVADINIFSEYTKMIALTDLKNYEKVKNTVIKNSDNFKVNIHIKKISVDLKIQLIILDTMITLTAII